MATCQVRDAVRCGGILRPISRAPEGRRRRQGQRWWVGIAQVSGQVDLLMQMYRRVDLGAC